MEGIFAWNTTMTDRRNFTDNEIKVLVEDYLRSDRFGSRGRYDPQDDFTRLLTFASFLPGWRGLPKTQPSRPPPSTAHLGGMHPLRLYIDSMPDILFEANPSISKADWRAWYAGVLAARHGGTPDRRVYIRKRPALEKQHDAKLMTSKQLKEKYPHLCPSRIHKLIKDASKRK